MEVLINTHVIRYENSTLCVVHGISLEQNGGL